MKKIITTLIVLAVIGLGAYFIHSWYADRLYRNPDLATGNGRLEATEINIAARLAGKVEKVNVLEGERVSAGQPLVVMQTNVLVANLAKAEAEKEQAIAEETSARANIALQKATLHKMKSDLERTKAIEANAKTKLKRDKRLVEVQAISKQQYDNVETAWQTAKANLFSAEAAIMEAEANLKVAEAQAIGAKANILAADAKIASIKADIDDSILKAPINGRVQYRVAEPGEVLSAGGRAINMVDLTDVYITFFLPEETAGKVKIGADVRILLDAFPDLRIPAKISYVASVAQFTPKTVETRVERQKLMFRVKAHIDAELLKQFRDVVKTGLPGVAWVKLNDAAAWPKELDISAKSKEKAMKMYKEMQQQGVKGPASVIQSQTKQHAKANILEDREKLEKDIKKATKEKALDIQAEAAKRANAKRNQTVEQSVKKAKAAEKVKQEKVAKTADAAKKADAAAKKAVVKDNAK